MPSRFCQSPPGLLSYHCTIQRRHRRCPAGRHGSVLGNDSGGEAHPAASAALSARRRPAAEAARRVREVGENSGVAAPRITREELKQRIDSGAALVIIDARLKYPYEHSTVKLPGALRVMRDDPLPQVPPGAEVVVYDSDPNELAGSHLVARFIRSGIRAAALKGG